MKSCFCAALSALFAQAIFAAGFETKGIITLGATPVEHVLKSNQKDTTTQFGGAYLLGNIAVSNDKLTAAGKIYWRLGATGDIETLSQKIDIKRAYIRFRPFGNTKLEFSGGKLYSYYLSGNYFQIAEIYTGASRWGKTGIGAKAQISGFTFGLALPLSESYVQFNKNFGAAAAAEFDFSSVISELPLKMGASLLYDWTKDRDDEHELSKMVSLYYTPDFDGIISKMAVTLAYTHNAEPFTANSVYKNVTNYATSDMKKSPFVSLNFRGYVGGIQILAEGEAGHSIDGDIVPLYAGAQALVPIVEHVAFKGRACYYAALDTDDSDRSRQTVELYPRAWLTFDKWAVSAGFDMFIKQTTKDDWEFEWGIPMYVEYKIGK